MRAAFLILLIKIIVNIRCDDSCSLDPDLIKEIQSYKNVAKLIMDTVHKSGKELYENYTEFVDKFGPRMSGTQNLERAIDYMINLTLANGIPTVTTEPVDVPHWVRGEETAKMIKPRLKHVAIFGLGSSVPTPDSGITAEVIVVKSFADLDKLEDDKVKGKIVVYNPDWVNYTYNADYRHRGAVEAAKKGAVAALVRSVTPFSIYTPHTGSQQYDDKVKKIPVASVTVEDADLFERFQNRGVKIVLSMKMQSTLDTQTSRNTLIDLKGREKPDQFVIVSGHVDSWDVGQGAMDDGGGMFISWFVPVVLHQLGLTPRRTLRAILWTAEEPGLYGAAAYLDKYKNELDKINFMMESDDGTFKPQGLGVKVSKRGLCILTEVLKLFTPIDKLSEEGAPSSDIELFVDKGVPGGWLLDEGSESKYFYYHHTDADTMDVQNMDDVINCAAFWSAVSYVIADLSADIPRN